MEKCTDCTLEMRDTYGDSWNGVNWIGFGQSYDGPTTANKKKWISRNFTTGGCKDKEEALTFDQARKSCGND